MSGSGVEVLDMRKVVPQNSQTAISAFRAVAGRDAPQLGQLNAFIGQNYTIFTAMFDIQFPLQNCMDYNQSLVGFFAMKNLEKLNISELSSSRIISVEAYQPQPQSPLQNCAG